MPMPGGGTVSRSYFPEGGAFSVPGSPCRNRERYHGAGDLRAGGATAAGNRAARRTAARFRPHADPSLTKHASTTARKEADGTLADMLSDSAHEPEGSLHRSPERKGKELIRFYAAPRIVPPSRRIRTGLPPRISPSGRSVPGRSVEKQRFGRRARRYTTAEKFRKKNADFNFISVSGRNFAW